MKMLLLYTTLAICIQLNLAKYKTTPPYKTPKPTLSIEEKDTLKLLDSWNNPPPQFKKKVSLTVEQYAHWSSTVKYVPPKQKLQPTYVLRFCKCKKLDSKRSLVTRVKRQRKRKPKDEPKKRMEWRTMTTEDRKSFIYHFNKLAESVGKKKSKLAVFAEFHRKSESPGAHKGYAFLPWHREYLYRFENELTDAGYEGGLPYWNSALDYDLKMARDSAIFTTTELGISVGTVGDPIKQKTVTADCEEAGLGTTIRRKARDTSDSLISRQKLRDLPWTDKYFNFSNALEKTVHNGVHGWFGGDTHMNDLNCVAFDPMFFLHHCYIDYLWEEYRKKYQKKVDTMENDYPTGTGVKLDHQKFRDMLPFDEKQNIDGLRVQYTNVYYTYEPSPGKCKTDRDCKSALLWCHKDECEGKVKERGECDRNIDVAQCYCPNKKGACEFGKGGKPNFCACQ